MTRLVHFRLLGLSVCICAVWACLAKVEANEPAITGYRSYEALRRELESIAAAPAAELESIGTTLGGREVYVLTLSIGDAEEKPAILVVGSVHAPHLLGSELAVRMARRLVDGAESDDSIRSILQEQAIYVIPLPSPDASEAFFHKPYIERTGNAHPTDDDRDGRTNEDGPEDLNGDGQITLMRIEDPTGSYMPHPADNRVLIEADAKKGERGRFRLEIEGIDNDKDESQGEDGPGGVAFDRNFTFEYPYFEPGAGPHQVSEPETRAVADFAFDHPNVYAVFSFSPHDNLNEPWKSGQGSGEIPISVHEDDVPYLDHIAEQYRDLLDGDDAPQPPRPEGSFVHWAYFHYGRWSLGTRGWWVPKVVDSAGDHESGEPSDQDRANESTAEAQSDAGSSEGPGREAEDSASNATSEPANEEPGAEDVNALRWLEQQGIDGFTEWTEFDHPDFPNQRVEVGGFHPYVRLNPPAERLDELAEIHTQFLVALSDLRPRLSLSIKKFEDLGADVYRISVEVRNDGYLPTESAMGSRARALQRLEARIELPDGASLVHGVERVSMGRLLGHGGAEEHKWLFRAPDTVDERNVKIIVGSPTTGVVETNMQLP